MKSKRGKKSKKSKAKKKKKKENNYYCCNFWGKRRREEGEIDSPSGPKMVIRALVPKREETTQVSTNQCPSGLVIIFLGEWKNGKAEKKNKNKKKKRERER